MKTSDSFLFHQRIAAKEPSLKTYPG